MTKHKEQEFKDFLISRRKSTGPGFTNVPVWIIQKKGERIWNKKQKRTWKDIGLGKSYRKLKLDDRDIKGVKS